MIYLGKIVKVRGNKGEVIITSPNSRSGDLKKGEIFVLKSRKYQKTFKIENSRMIKGVPVVKLEGIDTINDAYRLVGYEIHGDEKTHEPDAPPPLIDFTVKDIHGDVWGTVQDFSSGEMNELLEVYDPIEEDTYYIPFSEEIIKSIDEENRLILIDPPAGLKELNKK